MKIQKYILIVLTVLAPIISVMAQEKKPGLPTGAQTVIIDRPDGMEYISATGRFKILFPGVPQEFEGTYETKIGQIASHFVMLATDVTHVVNYTDYPMNVEQPELVKRVLDNARKNVRGQYDICALCACTLSACPALTLATDLIPLLFSLFGNHSRMEQI